MITAAQRARINELKRQRAALKRARINELKRQRAALKTPLERIAFDNAANADASDEMLLRLVAMLEGAS